jgi:recombination-promoting nuclease RpnB
MLENIDPMATLLAVDYNDDLSIDVIFYLLRHGDTDNREKVVDILRLARPQLEEKIMTIEEQWRLESRQEVTLEMARRMLAEKLDLNTIMKVTGLSDDELQQLNSWLFHSKSCR